MSFSTSNSVLVPPGSKNVSSEFFLGTHIDYEEGAIANEMKTLNSANHIITYMNLNSTLKLYI